MTSKKNTRISFIMSLLERSGSTGSSITEIHNAILDRFPVTRKTIARDILELSCIYPIIETSESPARFSLSPDYKRSHELNLSEQDIQIVLLSLATLRSNSPDGLGHLAAVTEEHLISALPRSLRELAYTQRELHKTHRPLEGRSIGTNTITASRILESLRLQKCVQIEYSSPYKLTSKETRTFSPIIFEMTGGTPYLIAHDLMDKKIKKLRLNRIQNLTLLNEKAISTDPKSYAMSSMSVGGVTVTKKDLVQVELTGDDYLGTYFQEYQFSSNQAVSEIKSGSFKVTFEAPILPSITRLLLSLSPHIYSISPKRLQKMVLMQLHSSYVTLGNKKENSPA